MNPEQLRVIKRLSEVSRMLDAATDELAVLDEQAVQARQLGHGGIEYVSRVLGCSTRTVSRGMIELDRLPDDPAAGRIRRPGAGRKKTMSR